MTHQEIFDKVSTHLLTQGYKSDSGGTCLYRDFRGGQCAVGCLMTSGQYHPDLEGYSARLLDDIYDELDIPVPDWLTTSNIELLEDLQAIHDRYMPEHEQHHYPPAMTQVCLELREAAQKYHLAIPAAVQTYLA